MTLAPGSPADSPTPGHGSARPWTGPAVALAGFVALAGLKFWPLLRPWERVSFGGDLTLGIEGFFYSQLKRGVVRLWDPTMVTGDLTLGGGAHTPFSTPALFHLFYPPGLLVFGLAERDQHIPHFVLVCFLVAHFVALGAFTALYARSLGIGRPGAFLSGATVMPSHQHGSHRCVVQGEHLLEVAAARPGHRAARLSHARATRIPEPRPAGAAPARTPRP